MKWCMQILLVAPLLLAAAPAPLPKPEQADIAALQGFWVLKTTEYLGLKGNEDITECPIEKKLLKLRRGTAEEREVPVDFKKYRTTLEFKGNTYDFRRWYVPLRGGEAGIDSQEGTYKLDVRQSPRVMEKWYTLELAEPLERVFYCTYQVRGDTLKLGVHFDNDRKKLPKTFTTDKDENVAVLTFRREKR